MKAIMVMYDSLNRHMLPAYGCDWTHAPNFQRLAEKSLTFDNCYVGSMPCMPARRELHTGRLNFLHRSWGPLEPFDDSMPKLLHKNGIHSHLVTDHWHYWDEGGANYHTKYSTHSFSRGQEGEGWMGVVGDIDIPDHLDGKGGFWGRQEYVNRQFMQEEVNQPQAKTFHNGLEFIELNHSEDNWFLQIETFDPHEPFFTSANYKEFYPHEYDGPDFDWPNYHPVSETREQIEHCRYEYAALLSMCDNYIGKVLDMMDKYNLWEDTMLIVNTDHGFILGEHEWWGKMFMPYYNEIANTPLFIWDPRAQVKGERRSSLVQTIDLAPTLLEYFDLEIPKDIQGKVLKDVIMSDKTERDYALFGQHGGHVCITDGRYVYMRAPQGGVIENRKNLNNYTLMPAHSKNPFPIDELENMELVDGFEFTKGVKVLKVAGGKSFTFKEINMEFPPVDLFEEGNMLFDLESDKKQLSPITDEDIEDRMCFHMVRLMKDNDSPMEQYTRLGLEEYFTKILDD
ncbi:sulfatase [Vallitalea sp.]|jgi:arylsulfatase A-like enzyme|uniref:sulfatase n=1 Tax=Vallitalea sp. TaxID=1882829 RepID=UPI0025FA5870|nr:sulfatase [Vallitalea sp.]MCT4686133.1 sulfatase [Vallitalea sp.]